MIPPLLLLAVVVLIWVTRAPQLLANNWAYPLTVSAVGVIALLLLWRARPRVIAQP